MKLLSEPDEDSSQLGLQMEVSKKISYSPLLLIELQTTKLLPIKIIEKNNYAIGQVIMMKV